MGGTVAQANKPPICGLQCPRGHRFDSSLLSFPDPLPTSSLLLTSCPKILHCPIQIKAKKPINKSKKKKNRNVLQNMLTHSPNMVLCLLCVCLPPSFTLCFLSLFLPPSIPPPLVLSVSLSLSLSPSLHLPHPLPLRLSLSHLSLLSPLSGPHLLTFAGAA